MLVQMLSTHILSELLLPYVTCNVWALVYGLCNYLDDKGRTLLLHDIMQITCMLHYENDAAGVIKAAVSACMM